MASFFDTKFRSRVAPYGLVGAAGPLATTGVGVDLKVGLGVSQSHNAGIPAFAADAYALVRRGAG